MKEPSSIQNRARTRFKKSSSSSSAIAFAVALVADRLRLPVWLDKQKTEESGCGQ
jgi:hypothetical protein